MRWMIPFFVFAAGCTDLTILYIDEAPPADLIATLGDDVEAMCGYRPAIEVLEYVDSDGMFDEGNYDSEGDMGSGLFGFIWSLHDDSYSYAPKLMVYNPTITQSDPEIGVTVSGVTYITKDQAYVHFSENASWGVRFQAILHEWGHMYGLKHENDEGELYDRDNVMHPLIYVNDPVSWLDDDQWDKFCAGMEKNRPEVNPAVVEALDLLEVF